MASLQAEAEALVKARFPYAEDQARLVRLSSRGWRPVAYDSPHPLHRLQGLPLGRFRLQLLHGPKNRYGASYFQAFLQDSYGRASREPVLVGLHSVGRYPAYNWVEVISLTSQVAFAATDALVADAAVLHSDVVRLLFQRLADVVPPGGHLMVEYESAEQRATERALAAGVPPAATSLGSLLLEVGCGAGFRDWHFAEGGSEGAPKLMGFKPSGPEMARLKARQVAQELLEFVERPRREAVSEAEAAALQQAASVLQRLSSQVPELADRIRRVAGSFGL